MAAVNVNELASMLALIEMNARQAREMLLSSTVLRQRAQAPGVLLGGTDSIAKIQQGRVEPSPAAQMTQRAINMSEMAKGHINEVLAFAQSLGNLLTGNQDAPAEANAAQGS